MNIELFNNDGTSPTVIKVVGVGGGGIASAAGADYDGIDGRIGQAWPREF